jgi:hypothetical protein
MEDFIEDSVSYGIMYHPFLTCSVGINKSRPVTFRNQKTNITRGMNSGFHEMRIQ